jgi:hypothetical protein
MYGRKGSYVGAELTKITQFAKKNVNKPATQEANNRAHFCFVIEERKYNTAPALGGKQ